MNVKSDSHGDAGGTGAKREEQGARRAYKAPALKVFGSVRQLTRGMAASGGDGASGMGRG